MDQRQCISCRARFIPLRNPNQRYCSKSSCQRKREGRYKRQKLKNDIDYKENQRKAQKCWYKKNSDYWKSYRQRNQEYTKSNRTAQHIRNKNRHQKKPPKVIAKIMPLNQEKQDLSIICSIILLSLEVIAKRERYGHAISDLLALPP